MRRVNENVFFRDGMSEPSRIQVHNDEHVCTIFILSDCERIEHFFVIT